MLNIDIKRGFLCEDAQIFLTRAGRPKVTFRLRVPRDRYLPQKTPVNADFFSVVAYGDRYVDLAPLLMADTEVLTIGITQSRDVGNGSVVTEILAREIIVFPRVPDQTEQQSREGDLTALAWHLASEWDTLMRQGQDPGQWSVEDLSRWMAEKLRSHIESPSAGRDQDDTTGD